MGTSLNSVSVLSVFDCIGHFLEKYKNLMIYASMFEDKVRN
jgi:hypothetical protein